MAWLTTKGFNFRDSVGFVTDGTNQKYSDDDDAYPNSDSIGGDSVVSGWLSLTNIFAADRDTGIDVRLAGLEYVGGGAATYESWQCDLPAAGNYKVRLALGDAGFAQANSRVAIWDSTVSQLLNRTEGTSVAGHFVDAAGVDYAAAAWPGSNSQVTLTFTTSTFIMRVYANSGALVSTVAHLEIEQVAVSSGSRKLVKTFVSLAGLVLPFAKAANGLYLRDTRMVMG